MSGMVGARAFGHAHGEAFMLMRYRCKDCGGNEIIWNSRDGVTPFGVDCRACGGEATHVAWGEDRYKPDFMPPLGTRMFVDLTPERHKALSRRQAERYWESYPPSREQFASVDDLAAMLSAHALTPGEPDLIEVAG